MATFFALPIFQVTILPFLLAFALIFAILEKSKFFGSDKHQINAIIAFVAGIILISFSKAVGIITNMMAFLSVALVVFFVFLLVWAFIWSETTGDPLKNAEWLKWALGLVFLVAVVIALLIYTDYWQPVKDFFTSGNNAANIFFVIFIIAAIAAVVYKKGDNKDKKKD